ncbi:hypothetical protein [Streptomyces sp. H39-C1]|uniref:hypothetical protein n=1 Tax=Streptomyces sp. H39-C1 TaxID=3004355 RepID=UPI0022AE8005|nr:hypothetical protein [Streptomyces sp. H39-C1]MCZ4098004.1 hypothetical protein [Streptomyces sp. H39-C1]
MVQTELRAGLVTWGARVTDAQRRVREAGPAEQATRVRVAAGVRRDAFKFLATACRTLSRWPAPADVESDGAEAAMTVLTAADAAEIRALLPLLTRAAQHERVSTVCVAEATDALCAAEQRPQLYGTIPDYPVADPARLATLRARVGLPTNAPLVKTAPLPEPAPAPLLKQLPEELAMLEGLLTDLPAVPALPRVVRPTVGTDNPWGCAYCCGPARPGACELDIRGRVWRICTPCEEAEDTPQGRLLDVLLAVGNVSDGAAHQTAALARKEGWRVPLRYEDTRARPNHRPQPRWAHVPAGAVAKLVAFAEHHQRLVPVPAPQAAPPVIAAQRGADAPAPQQSLARPVTPQADSSPAANSMGSAPPGWGSCLLHSKRAAEMLSWPGDVALTQLQVSQALQLAPGTLDRFRLTIATVTGLHEVFADPPTWLVDFHGLLAHQRSVNYVRQTMGTSTPPAPSPPPPPPPVRTPAARPAVSGETTAAAPRPVPPAGPPHPEMLLSQRAVTLLAKPPKERLKPGQVAKALQVAALATVQKHHLVVTTVDELAAVFHAPPAWLLEYHRKLATEREAELARLRAVPHCPEGASA